LVIILLSLPKEKKEEGVSLYLNLAINAYEKKKNLVKEILIDCQHFYSFQFLVLIVYRLEKRTILVSIWLLGPISSFFHIYIGLQSYCFEV